MIDRRPFKPCFAEASQDALKMPPGRFTVGISHIMIQLALRLQEAAELGVEFERVQIPREREGGRVVQDSVERGVRECLHQIHCTADELSHSRRREEALRPGVHPTHLLHGGVKLNGGDECPPLSGGNRSVPQTSTYVQDCGALTEAAERKHLALCVLPRVHPFPEPVHGKACDEGGWRGSALHRWQQADCAPRALREHLDSFNSAITAHAKTAVRVALNHLDVTPGKHSLDIG
mmetsp:Transcript_31665/g.53208  ORF Transcript_31665/g.53208 Transcript_31665/m.53208 type:complete len:234 (+) Transcript_31665:412-1113(+)